MPNATSVGAVEPLEAPDNKAMSAARERRESEIVITDWEEEARRLGRALALMTLDLSAMTGPKWAHRFVISVGPVAEDCILLFYGASFAALMQLPANPEYSVPMMAHFPVRYVPVFAKGCMDAMFQVAPVRMPGAVDRGGRAARALPGSVHPLEHRCEAPATPRARRVQLPRGRTAGLLIPSLILVVDPGGISVTSDPWGTKPWGRRISAIRADGALAFAVRGSASGFPGDAITREPLSRRFL
jgi:hypothetical protein